MSEHIQELWDEPTIPDGVEAFWDRIRESSYPELPETDDGLCALYDAHEEELDGYTAETVLIGQYDAASDAIQTELRATYLTAEQDIATADTVELEYGLDEMVDDGYSITALNTSDVQPLQEAIVEAQDRH